MVLLSLTNISSFYGNIQALDKVNLSVNKGEIVTLIGANGAGKSTLLMTICGRPQARNGHITFEKEDITSEPTHIIAQKGISQVPEGRRIFPNMTILENLQLGALISGEAYFEKELNNIFHLFPILKKRQKQKGGTLSGGEQQMLAIGRALLSNPTLLLLDEPSLGLAPKIVQQIFEIIREINKTNKTTILLVEQNAYQALNIANRGYVMVNGRIVMEGSAKSLLEDKDIGAAYLHCEV